MQPNSQSLHVFIVIIILLLYGVKRSNSNNITVNMYTTYVSISVFAFETDIFVTNKL